ncbi:helix-turn-helix transcriptional regulator [Cryptosporangium phraense]|uniref:Helix-turn-helix transcriptional regulator n=2 Tax=Cryptosporangium phraense TaxID=2593070 RepID=A0A545AFM0_9ACTN|nr:helix-turn-helix transcriptional regulator [Cryptosporangium phraense]
MLDAARARIASGDLELPMNAIAKDAGVGVGTMYRHFATRRVLLETLAADSYAALIAEARAAAENPDVAAGLAGLLRAALRCQLDDAALAEVLASSSYECAETLELGRELGEVSLQVLTRARAAGVIRDDVTADDMRRLTCGIRRAVDSGDDSDGTAADRYLDVVLKGLRP